MTAQWRSLRVRLAVLGFLAIYVPALLLFGVLLATDVDSTVELDDGAVVTRDTSASTSPWIIGTVVALGPVAAFSAWWWAGRAVRPIERVRAVAEEIGDGDLSRRIGLTAGPDEIVALASSFDAMLDRLERARQVQQQLIDEASHELRVPLSVLTANAEVMLAHPEPSVEIYREGLQRSGRAAERLRVTLEALLVDARGRARTIDRRPSDLMDVVRGAVEDASLPVEAGVAEVSIIGPSSAMCTVDAVTVRRAVANLVHNAQRHAPRGSTVTVEVSMTSPEAVLTVADRGPGIPAAEQAHIFERFWRGAGDRAGTGLGLSIARHVAEAHGGSLTVTSPGPHGDGCVFRFRLRR